MTDGAPTSSPPARARLTREHVLRAALDYVDAHGLEALSMNKLGAELGVKGMSLYTHVTSRDALLDGIVEAIWAEVEPPATPTMTWPEAVRSYAHSLRDLILRHPAARPLLGRGVLPTRFLEHLDGYRQVLLRSGFSDQYALRALRAVHHYAIGSAVAEVSWGDAVGSRAPDNLTALRRVTDMVARDASDHLLRLAIDFCYCSTDGVDQTDQFESGLDLIVQGLEGWR